MRADARRCTPIKAHEENKSADGRLVIARSASDAAIPRPTRFVEEIATSLRPSR
jgi:hypothetical protein